MRLVLRQLNIVVEDMSATLAFYRRLGVEIPEDAVWSSGGAVHHVTADAGEGLQLEFDSPAPPEL